MNTNRTSATPDQPPEDPPIPPLQLRMDPTERALLGGCALMSSLLVAALGLPLWLPGDSLVGPAIVLGLPFTLGFLSGLLVPSGRILVMVGLLWGGIAMVIGGLLVRDMIGVFCSAIYAVVAFPPGLFAGLAAMYWRRRRQHARRNPRSDAFLCLAVLLLPVALHVQERLWPAHHAVEHLACTREIDAPLERVWAHSLGFEDAPVSPWEVIAAPLPRHAAGTATKVGDEKILRFAKGVIRLRVTRIDPGRLLVGEVIEQTIERKALLLQSITVACEPIGARTRATIRIDFEPRMGPRWYWRPFERFFGGITFDAVLGAWRHGVESPMPPRAPKR